MRFFLTMLMVIGIFPLFSDSGITGRKIMDMVDNAPDGETRKAILTMRLINKRGKERVRKIVSYSKDYGKDKKNLMFFMAPADVKGTGFLAYEYDDEKKEDDRWLYLPAMRKVRRISGSSNNDYFMGSDFTYDDMGEVDIDEYDYKLLKEEKYEGHDCWVVESKPKKRKNKMYSRKVMVVRKDALKVVKTDYYDWDKRLLKVFVAKKIELVQKIWTVLLMEIKNVQNNHKTILEFSKIEYDIEAKDSLFKVSSLQRGHIK